MRLLLVQRELRNIHTDPFANSYKSDLKLALLLLYSILVVAQLPDFRGLRGLHSTYLVCSFAVGIHRMEDQ